MRQVLTAPLVDNALSFIAPRYLFFLTRRKLPAANKRQPKKAERQQRDCIDVSLFPSFFRQVLVERRRTPLVIEVRDSHPEKKKRIFNE